MKLIEIHEVYPTAKLTRTRDGDGVALVAVIINKEDFAIIYAGEDNPYSKINLSKPVEFIETFNSSCSTKDGIRPGIQLVQAEKKLGKIKEIVQSEIEARQYATFKKTPQKVIFRIDYCGDFKNDMRRTTKYLLGCKILSIGVHSI